MAFKSPAPLKSVEPQSIPLKMVGGNNFSRYNKIDNSQTWNMITSDGALVDYAGYQNVFDEPLVANGKGRGIYSSTNGGFMVVVIGSGVWAVTFNNAQELTAQFMGTIATSQGDVFISENNNRQIGITDGTNMYVSNYTLNPLSFGILQTSTTSLTPRLNQFNVPFDHPGYISFQLGRLIVVDTGSQAWYLSGINAATLWSPTDVNNPGYAGTISLKPDHIQAAVPIPGAGNNIAIFGHTVMELWQFTGAAIFPYQRQSTYNVDYGCLNPSSIAALDSYIVWLSSNEQGGATVMVVNGAGGREESISTDGMDFKLANLTNPTNCTGFLFRQDGHLLYQFTFPDDNLSYVYDFNSKLFFTVSDENQNYHIARNVVFFDNDYYFVSLNDGNVYIFGTQFSSLRYSSTNVQMMPRIRICPPVRLPSQRMFIAKSLGFTIENGQPNEPIQVFGDAYLITQDGQMLITQSGEYLVTQDQWITLDGLYPESIDLSISRDGAETFGNSERRQMNPTGQKTSRLIWQRLGQANDFTPLIRFIGYGRFVAFDGELEYYT
jgi:hypothetical protein